MNDDIDNDLIPDEDDEEEAINEEAINPEQAYNALKVEAPVRKVDEDDDDDFDEDTSLENREQENPNESDLKATLRRLFPKFENEEINQIASAAMVARIQPDVFMPLLRLTVVSIIENHAEDEDVNINVTVNTIYAIMSIGLEGKGRIDALELAGSAKDAEELDRIAKGLGVG